MRPPQSSARLPHGLRQRTCRPVAPSGARQVVPWGDKEALAILQRQMDVDILVTGHTHAFEVGRARERGRFAKLALALMAGGRRGPLRAADGRPVHRQCQARSCPGHAPSPEAGAAPFPVTPPSPQNPSNSPRLVTHQADMYGERLQINPGSATGAYSSITPEAKPSFVLMDIDGSKVRG